MAAASGSQERLDVITIGRCSVDLYGQQIGSRLEDVASFAKSVGGCPANIAIGTARLGLRSALITRVGNEQMPHYRLERFGMRGNGLRVYRWNHNTGVRDLRGKSAVASDNAHDL